MLINKNKFYKNTEFSNSIIIPVYKDSEGLRTSLESLHTKGVISRPDTEVIVCNDGGGKNISSLANQYNVRVVELIKNQGSYAARNRGIEATTGKTLIFLDADQKIDENWLDKGIKALENADYVGGRIIVEHGETPTTWEIFDTFNAFPVEQYINQTHYAPAANLFVRREVFDKVGLFNEKLRSGGDYEFGQRVHRFGFKQTYSSEAITFHPARNYSQQVKKLKRVGEGAADIDLFIIRKNFISILITEYLILFKTILETSIRLFCSLISSRKNTKMPTQVHILMKGKRKFLFHWFKSKRIFYWLFYKCD